MMMLEIQGYCGTQEYTLAIPLGSVLLQEVFYLLIQNSYLWVSPLCLI